MVRLTAVKCKYDCTVNNRQHDTLEVIQRERVLYCHLPRRWSLDNLRRDYMDWFLLGPPMGV